MASLSGATLLTFLAFLCTIAAAGKVCAVTWTGNGNGVSWDDGQNWDGGTVPGPADVAYLNPPPQRGPVIDSSLTVGSIQGPKWSSDSNQVMDVVGGTVVINGDWRFANGGIGVATVNIGGSADITVAGWWRASDAFSDFAVINIGSGSISCNQFRLGDDGGGEINVSDGFFDVVEDLDLNGRGQNPITLSVTGGLITVGGALKAPGNVAGAGVVNINLNEGTIRCASFTHAAPYYLDVEEGFLVIETDVRDAILADVNAGYITAYGGTADVVVEYDSVSDQTIVSALSAVGFDKAYSGGPETASPAVLTVTLHNPPEGQTVTVNYDVTGGTAVSDVDYVLVSGTLVFEPGVTSRAIEITIIQDDLVEQDETIELTLSNPVNALLGAVKSHTYTIADLHPAVEFDSNIGRGRENMSPFYISVSLSWVWNEPITVDYNVAGGTAASGDDYFPVAGTLVFEPGDVTEYIELLLVEDECDEDPDETIELFLSAPTNALLGANYLHSFTILPPLATVCPRGDLDGNCEINSNDLAIFAGQWLDPPGSCTGLECADLDHIAGVDMRDFATLAGNWRQKVFPVVINEFMASNATTKEDPDEDGEFPDWMELFNAGGADVDLSRMYLTDDLTEPMKWRIPAGLIIGAGEYVIFWADGDDGQGDTHTSYKLSADGEQIGLFDTDGVTLLDSVSFGRHETDISYGRYPDASDNWRFLAMPTPGWANNGAYLGAVADTKFSHKRGFYESSFNLSVTCSTDDAQIHYSLDGSEPNEFVEGNTYLYTGPLEVNQTTTLRAAAFKPGYVPSGVDTQTYIFLDDVLEQPAMDSTVVSTYGASAIKDGFKSIPTLSIVMDGDDYQVVTTEGVLKPEFPISLELIYSDPNDGEGFQTNCGASRHSHIKNKQALRLEFKSEFGPARLQYPFFESDPVGSDSVVDVFDRIVLRSPGNMPVTFVGDPWAAESQVAMCGIGAHSTHVHLYLNGEYRGIYNPKERPDAWFTSSYFGGDFEDYFATNHGIERCCGFGCPVILNSPCHLSGDYARFDQMMQMAYDRGLEDPNKYAQFTSLCDVQEFADYTVLFWLSGFGDNMDNNWYAGMRNIPLEGEIPPEGYMMFMWDAEYVFLNKGGPPGNEDPWVPYYYFNSGWVISDIWLALFDNPDFRMLFADRVHRHCFNDGALVDTNAQARWDGLTSFIDEAVICEKARWGGADTPTTVDMTGHVGIFINALRTWSHPSYPGVNLYPDIDPPVFNQHGGPVGTGFSLTMTNPNAGGTVYYTLDGTDPRQPVTGGVVGTAYTGPVVLNESRHVKARVWDGAEWSALNETTFAVGPVADNLRITELMYNPEETGDPNDPNTEYIELKNLGPETVNLNLVRFTNGIDFTFDPVEVVGGDYVVVVKDAGTFASKYPEFSGVIAGQYAGRLNNGGEKIRLQDAAGRTILDFRYSDGWRTITDGNGFSLTIIDAACDVNDWSLKDSWRPSAYVGGSPGLDDGGLVPDPGAIVINEVMAHSHDSPDWVELHNTTDGSISIGGWFLSDSDSNLLKYEIALPTIIGAGDYLVLYEDVHFGDSNNPGCNIPFAFSENGDKVCLASALDGNGNLTGYRQIEDFGASQSNVSFGRHYKGSTDNYNFVAMDYNTPGMANADPMVGPIAINEIMYHPDWPPNSLYSNEDFEYIELYNITGSDVSLYDEEGSTWKFVDGIEYDFPPGTIIGAYGYLVVVKNPDAFGWRYPGVPEGRIFGPYDGGLGNSGEKIELAMPGDLDKYGTRHYIRVDRVNYSDGSDPDDCPGSVDLWPAEADGQGKSLCRISASSYGNDVSNWSAGTASPASGNP